MRQFSICPFAPLWLVAGAVLEGCAPKPSVSAAAPPPAFRLEATVQELMEGLIDPSADAVWDSVAYISSPKGIEDRQPRTDEEWNGVRSHALMLIEGGNLLAMPGRRAVSSRPGTATPAPGELGPNELQERLQTIQPAFAQLASGLQAAAAQALAAIDARNVQALMDAGSVIDDACEACHVVFWYPNQHRP